MLTQKPHDRLTAMTARRLAFEVAFAIVLGAISAVAVEPTHTVSVPMTDGTQLVSDIYVPPSGDGPWPVVLARSTYGRIGGPKDALLQQGIAVVVQDVRGMGASEGEKFVFNADGWRPGLTDGADTITWVRTQPWCNGKIGTWGGSALGITQMLLAPATPHVAAQYIEIAPSDLYEDMFYQGGVFRKSLLEGWLPQIGHKHLLPVYKAHPAYDDFWSYYNIEARAGDIAAPGMFVGGWYDIFQQGTIDAFTTRELNGGAGAKGNNYLIMKWGAHLDKPTPDYTFNENRYALDMNQALIAFYARTLLGNANALDGFAKVHYYVIGADTPGAPGNEWRTADAWPPFATDAVAYHLTGNGRLTADKPSSGTDVRAFTFDPKNPFPTSGGANLMIPAGPYDQRKVNKGRKDLLHFTTTPLRQSLEITGRVTVRLFVSSDAPDTDFTAKLLDIYPRGDGRQILILDGIRRVKTRLGYDQIAPPLGGPDDVVEVEIDLQSTSWIFAKGHRIGLDISSSNFPRFEINPNTGADFPSADASMREARNAIHMNDEHPSAVVIPVRRSD